MPEKPKKYKNKYRITSPRLQSWDYGWAGAYFITICTKNRVNYFGNISDGQSKFSSIGIIQIFYGMKPWHRKLADIIGDL